MSFHLWCSYKGRGQKEDSQLVGTNHHLRVVFLQRSPRCFGQVRTGARAHKMYENSVKYSQIWVITTTLCFPLSRSYLVTRNQASSVYLGDTLMYVLMCGMAWLLPVESAFHRLNTQISRCTTFKIQSTLKDVRDDMLQLMNLLEEGVKPQLLLSCLDAVGKRASRLRQTKHRYTHNLSPRSMINHTWMFMMD